MANYFSKILIVVQSTFYNWQMYAYFPLILFNFNLENIILEYFQIVITELGIIRESFICKRIVVMSILQQIAQ